ncbi:MAG: valine--tRNA ligase [Parvularculaceae bacterium]
MLNKRFAPAEAEPRIYAAWEAAGAFKPADDPDAEPFTIVIPPPNVTGSLHMGHALNNTLQDVLCRFERMRGKSVLWQVGLDHAGIATQMVVARQMAERGEPRRTEIGRERFIEKVWAWKAESGGQIINQLKRLGATCDWSRERFTMDEGLSRAVVKVFVQLYEQGLIYRDKRLVNWDPKFETAISDLEVENTEVDGHFWHFKYPLENGDTYEFPIAFDEDGTPTEFETRDYISIATTRPETMLGDGAVAVHPDDRRYAPIVGKRCHIPVGDDNDGKGRLIPIVTDDYPDPDFGSGAVKITGAHDFNDYQVAKRNDIEMFVLMDTKARMLDAPYVPAKYRGLDRYKAREAVVADIDARGLMINVEDKKIVQPFGDRSGVVIEPMLTDQWYVNTEALAKRAVEAVEKGETRFVPDNWAKTYYQWMRNIEPWCISRQLWWGHRIPAWHAPGGEIFVAETEAQAREMARATLGTDDGLERDPDVLDTWFSSGLWPFSTLGWPDETPELAARYPTSVLVTAFDIIFFWVARMMMQGLNVMDEVPFKDVYMHALVLDEHGQKMSKSKGNVIDPLALIDRYGADPLRFTLAAMAAQGRNIRLSEQRIEGYRNFSTKLWNAAKFAEINGCKVDPAFDPAAARETLSRWIVHETARCAAETTEALEAYRFNDAAGAVYRFAWNVFCDWHLEFAKPVLQGPDGPAKDEVRAATAWCLDQILKLLHPFMPFVTEELWGALAERDRHLILADWPVDLPSAPEAAEEINWALDLITQIRSVRQAVDLPAGDKFPLVCVEPDDLLADRLALHAPLIERLARLEGVSAARDGDAPRGVALVSGGATYVIDIAGAVDPDAVRARLDKEIAKADKEIGIVDKKLANKNFVDRAPAEVVDEQRERRAGYAAERDKLAAALARL